MKFSYKDVALLLLLAVAIAVMIVFDTVNIIFSADEVVNALLKDFVPRITVGAILIAVIIFLGDKQILIPKFKRLHLDLLWCVPCIFVVLANFPFTAIIGGAAKIERVDLVWLFILKCLSVGLMEEALFRGLVQSTVHLSFKDDKYAKFKTAFLTSVFFSAFHLLNLFAGASVNATLMQVGYSFLIGAMLSAVLFKTENLWLCVIFHALFNAGGYIITDLGSGRFQDVWFWTFTVVFGVICFFYVLYYLTEQKFFKLIFCNLTAVKRKIGGYEWKGETYEDIAYSELSPTHTLDLYVPETKNPPLLIFVHGGGFVAGGSKTRQAALCTEYFRANGYACASVNYRLADEAKFPAAVCDVKAAVKFLRAHAEEYGFNAENIALMGESAGGYIAAMVALSGEDEFNDVPHIGGENVNARVSSLTLFYPLIELDRRDADFKELGYPHFLLRAVGSADTDADEKSCITRFLGGRADGLSEEKLRFINPLTRLQSSKRIKVFVTHGEADITAPIVQSVRFCDECEKAFKEGVIFVGQPNYKHADDRFFTPENLERLKTFLIDFKP